MSWAADTDAIREFAAESDRNYYPNKFLLDVWDDDRQGGPNGGWLENLTDCTHLQSPSTGLRIVLAPLDLPQNTTKDDFLSLFRILNVPQAFVRERLQSVSHSFGSVGNQDRHRTWFHHLCKHIQLAEDRTVAYQELSRFPNKGASGVPLYGSDSTLVPREEREMVLPQADYRWRRSGFFLDVNRAQGTVMLCCFGANGKVKERLMQFLALKDSAWRQALDVPFVLLEVVLGGLYSEVDDNVWNMNSVLGALEHKLLVASSSGKSVRDSKELAFAGLHNVAKHITHLKEAVQASLLLTETIAGRAETLHAQGASQPGKQPERVDRTQRDLHDLLGYRKSLLQSTRLRLESLDHRVSNSIGLSFNLLTVTDSSVLIQHSSVMKIMAAITIIFLPTTAVAAIMGGSLLESTFEDGNWSVRVTPVFGFLWAVAVPLTVIVLIAAALWHWRTHQIDEKNKGSIRRLTGL